MDSMQPLFANVQAGPSKGGNEFIDVDEALGYEFPEVQTRYDERDVALYALGVGAASDPTDEKDLALVYELHGEGFKVLPTFGVIPAINTLLDEAKAGKIPPGQHYGFERILHGEQYTEVKRPLPPKATLTHKSKVTEIFDKGKNALVTRESRSYDENGDELLLNRFTAVVRGAGGWGGDRGPTTEENTPPDRKPDAVIEEKIGATQGLLYRLSGDWNPLHADPMMAQAMGFERPILHGLCTYGYAGRHVIQAYCGGDPGFFKSIKVRFADTVYPGETLVTQMWKESDHRIVFRCMVKERDVEVINRAAVELYSEIPKPLPKPKASPKAPTTEAAQPAGPESGAIFGAIDSYVKEHPELTAKIATTYLFKLSDPESIWTVNLKEGPGGVSAGSVAKPDCTLSLSDGDFMDKVAGKVDPQKLYFSGKLKVTGNVMASQKLEFLTKLDPKTIEAAMEKGLPQATDDASPADVILPSDTPAAAAIFSALTQRLSENPGLASETRAVLLFDVKGPEGQWTVDLKSAPGSVKTGRVQTPDTTLTLEDADLEMLARGEANAAELFQRGRLRVDGDMQVAHRLGFLKNLL
jgi:3-hydroxyacyl-CoA dehydrogenase/3a,7a,12a-trihydroxy-5b-cholest-24-enoyl-CoA hydratase